MSSPFDELYLRLDVDRVTDINKVLTHMLGQLRIQTGLPVPFFLNHVKLTKKFLKNYDIPRMWFFRSFTCPNHFDEPYGLHSYSPRFFRKELDIVESKLGTVKFFTRHGFAGIRIMNTRIRPYTLFHHILRTSGASWKKDEIKSIEKEYDVTDVTNRKRIGITTLKTNYDLNWAEQILFHPCDFRSHYHILEEVLDACMQLKSLDGYHR